MDSGVFSQAAPLDPSMVVAAIAAQQGMPPIVKVPTVPTVAANIPILAPVVPVLPPPSVPL